MKNKHSPVLVKRPKFTPYSLHKTKSHLLKDADAAMLEYIFQSFVYQSGYLHASVSKPLRIMKYKHIIGSASSYPYFYSIKMETGGPSSIHESVFIIQVSLYVSTLDIQRPSLPILIEAQVTVNKKCESDNQISLDNTLLTFKLPPTLLPGKDVLSKRILNDQKIIDLIAKSLLNIPEGTYGTASSEWNNNTRSDILYLPMLNIQRTLPPILIEVQATVEDKFIQRAIKYSINVIERYGTKPIVLIFCINGISPKTLAIQFKETEGHQYIKQFPCSVWAQECLLLFEKEENLGDSPLEPLQAISSFFCQQKVTLFDHTYSHSEVIIILYKIAEEVTKEEVEYEDNYRHALDTVIESNEKCLHKIKESLADIPDLKKAERLINKGLAYNNKVKKHLCYISDSDSDLELPKKIPAKNKRQTTSPELEKEIAFIKKYKQRIGRMNWKHCLEEAHAEDLLKRYSTGESLRINFSQFLKSKPLKQIENNYN